MPHCAVIWCNNQSKNVNKQNSGVSYHKFPNDPYLKNKWILATGKYNWFPQKHDTICSDHFETVSFKKRRSRSYLSSDAIPTLKLHPIFNEENHSADYSSSFHSKSQNKMRKLDDDLENNETDTDSDIDDEYYAWAKECALELRRMEQEQQIFAKRAITYILMEGHLGLLNRNSVLVNNKVAVAETIQTDSYISPLDEFLVIHKGSPGSSSISASHKTTVPSSVVKSKSSDKPEDSSSLVKTSRTTAALGGSSFFDNTGSSFKVASHKTAKPSSSVAKTNPCENKGEGSSSMAGYQEVAAPTESSSIVIKLEPFDDAASSSHNIATSICLSPLLVKSEPWDDIGLTSLPASPSRYEVNIPPSHFDVKSELNSPRLSPTAEYTPDYTDEPE